MRSFTVHLRGEAAPVLVPERFSWGALIFGPLWLLARRAWIAGVLALCAEIAIAVLTRGGPRLLVLAGLAWALGLFGQDLRRWGLARRGFVQAHVVAAADADAAAARLHELRPEMGAVA